jgi:hypothetical protein
MLDAIRKVESGGFKDPSKATGDNGKAIGPYQIHYVYWKDAVDFDRSIGGQYADCRNQQYAEKIVLAYLRRYAPNWNAETLSRIHNGGPKGNRINATNAYWSKVCKYL